MGAVVVTLLSFFANRGIKGIGGYSDRPVLFVLFTMRRAVVSHTTGTEFQWSSVAISNLTSDSEGQLIFIVR
jgi:hypothetical protein